jgi:hypothetical protein
MNVTTKSLALAQRVASSLRGTHQLRTYLDNL